MSKPLFISFKAVEYLSQNEGNPSSFFWGPFEYDSISDESITEELKNAHIEDLKSDWMAELKNGEKTNHAKRIAALVKLIESGADLPPVSIELSEYNRNTNMVVDGHHRIRALKYKEAKGFYADLGGFESLIKEFRKICRGFA
jgi:hypothetical protein